MNSSALTMIESQEYWQNYSIPAELLPPGVIPVNLAVGYSDIVWLNLLKEHKFEFGPGAFHFGSLMYGLLKFQRGAWQRFTFAELGLPELEHSFREFSCDYEERIWFFSPNKIIYSFNGTALQPSHAGENGLPEDLSLHGLTSSIAHDRQGRTWIALGQAGAFVCDGQNWLPFETQILIPEPTWVNKVIIDQNDHIWFVLQSAHRTYFVVHKNGQNNLQATLPWGYEKTLPRSFAVDNRGCIAVSWEWFDKSDLFLFVHDPSSQEWVRYNHRNSALLPISPITSIAIDKQQRIWIGHDSGVTIFANDQSISYEAMTPKGLKRAVRNQSRYYSKEHQNRLQQIALAGNEGDAHSYLLQGQHLASDQQGNIWIRTHNGVCVFKASALPTEAFGINLEQTGSNDTWHMKEQEQWYDLWEEE